MRWTVDTLGWKGRGGGDAGDVVDRVLPEAIGQLRARGYDFVTLDALL